jgi:hypothetical protein
MKKEIVMSIHDFMEIERGNKTLKDINNNSSKHILNTMGKIGLILAIMCIATPAPIKVLAADITYVEAVNTTGELLYITTAALLGFAYDVVVSTAAVLC